MSSSASPSRWAKPLPAGWIHREPKRTWAEGEERSRATDWLHALWVLTRHEFRIRYRAQALGVVWSLLHPIVMMGILSLIFTKVFRSGQPNFPIFMLIGLLIWQFFSNAVNSSAGAFVGYAEIIKRTVLPRPILPIALMLSYGINFLMESTVLLIFVPIFPEAFTLSWALLLVPIVLSFMVVLLAGLSLAIAALNVIYRDVQYLVTTALMIFYWLTPLIYPIEIVPEPFQTALKCSPLTGIVGALRGIVMEGRAPSALMWASIVLPSLAMLGIGWLIFRHYEQMVLDNV